MSVSYFAFEDNFLAAMTSLIMAPFALVHALLCGLWAIAAAIWPYYKHIGATVGLVGVGWLFVACPLLPIGLLITAGVGWVSYPRTAVRS